MTRARVLILLGIVFLILILGVGAGAWWYLYGPNKVDAAELVPSDTLFYATIPNAATIATGYQTSQLKQLVDSPNTKPLSDSIVTAIGQKNIDLFNAFLPNLSGQSFFAVTHFDSNHPEQTGLIAGLKPKAGMGSFDAFIAQLKTSYPDFLKQGTTGMGNVAGVDYQWLKGPGATDKICVAQVSGWIITTWGEASLQDWIERFHKKSATPSLAQNTDYQKSVTRVGNAPMTLLYVNYHAALDILQKQFAKTNSKGSDYLAKKFAAIGGMAIGTDFENGEIVDRFSCLIPHQAQVDAGMASAPCPFETLKFTGPATRLYWAASVDWQQYAKNIQDQENQSGMPNPIIEGVVRVAQNWAQGAGIDLHHNILDALGPEVSVQMEWNDDKTYPEIGLFVKIAKPDDFKPTIDALIATARKTYALSAVITELNANGQTFSALKFIQAQPFVPTITETGPYFGVFSSENLAVGSYSRDDSSNLTHNADFTRQIGDKRNGAAQISFIDTPKLADRAYRMAMPYVSLMSLFNKQLAAMLQGKTLPPDLTWLAPMGTWSFVMTPDDAGIQAYSVSGIGNQGILLAGTAGGAMTLAQSLGMLPKFGLNRANPAPPAPVAPTPTPGPANSQTPSGSAATPLPDTTTSAPPAALAPPGTNAAPAAPDSSVPSAPSTNSATPAPEMVPPASSTNTDSTPSTNSSPTPASPDATKTQ
jgi:hypothetical protein